MKDEARRIRERFVEAAGHVTQSFGAGRVLGQIFAHIYFSRTPQTLADLTRVLGISKGSASMSVRQLEQWGAVNRVWVKGDRKDYYEANDEFGRIIRKALIDMVGRKMETSDNLIEEAEAALKGHNGREPGDEDTEFLRARVDKIRTFRDRSRGLWESPLLQMLLKK